MDRWAHAKFVGYHEDSEGLQELWHHDSVQWGVKSGKSAEIFIIAFILFVCVCVVQGE